MNIQLFKNNIITLKEVEEFLGNNIEDSFYNTI